MDHNSYLPFLPGYSFSDPTKTDFGQHETLLYNKGCPLAKSIIPTTAKYALELLDSENRLYDNTLVELTYGKRRTFLKKDPVPDYLTFNNQVLRFYGYYREDVDDCWGESFRIHQVRVLYYLIDDTIEIVEPRVANSGLPQGLLLQKQRVSHPDGQRMYLWKDFNIGNDLVIYGKLIRLTDCDTWTKEYLESAGIILNPKVDSIPEDSYSQKLRERARAPEHVTPSFEDEKLWKFLNNDRHVLRFYGLWDDTLNIPPEKRKLIILYYLVDDTIEVLEVHWRNNGRDPAAVLVKRQKIPHDLNSLPNTFPSCYLEYSEKEIKEWFTPRDFGISKTIIIFNRKIFIYDCDMFTREYYLQEFGVQMPTAIDVEKKPKPPVPKTIPPHTGVGTWEDSLQSCIYSIPKPPKKDLLKLYNNDDKFLRFAAHMDTVWPIDQTRKFVITFFPGDDTVQINEARVENSGIASGTFLRKIRVSKPENTPDNRPVYYTAADFYIGAEIFASGRKFVIDDADRYVLSFMQQNKDIYPEEIIEIHRQKTAAARIEKEPLRSTKQALQEEMRQFVVTTCGEAPLPISLDLGEAELDLELVREKLYAANVPVSNDHLRQAMKLCTSDGGKVDVDVLQEILCYAFGHSTN